jgi:ribonuclease PH
MLIISLAQFKRLRKHTQETRRLTSGLLSDVVELEKYTRGLNHSMYCSVLEETHNIGSNYQD